MTCARCGKEKPDVKRYSAGDPDLPLISLCDGCHPIASWELASMRLVTKSGTTEEWREAFEEPREAPS